MAQQISANEEAIRVLTRALALLGQMPASLERDQQELALQTALTVPIMAVRSYLAPELEAAVTRMEELGRRLGEPEAVIRSTIGLATINYIRGNIRETLKMGFEAQRLAEEHGIWVVQSNWFMGSMLSNTGAFTQGKTYFERAIAGYDPEHPINTVFGPDLAVFCHAWEAHLLWLLGCPDQALSYYHRAVEVAEKLQTPFNLALAHAYGAILYQLLRDRQGIHESARAARELCTKYGFLYYRDWGLILAGWADQDTERIHQGLQNLQALGAELRRPYYLGLLAETHLQLGQTKEADSILDAALATATQNGDVWWNAELYRLKGEITASEASFQTALEIARSQESKSLELRSAMSLARLWQQEGRSRQALELLEPVYTWFSEGLDTWDLQQAQKLIQTLSA